MSLRLRLGLVIGAVIVLAYGLLSYSVLRGTRHDLLSGTRQRLEQAINDRLRLTRPSPPGAAEREPRSLATAHLVADAKGTIVLAEAAGPGADPLPLPELEADDIERLWAGEEITVHAVDDSQRYLVRAAPSPQGVLEIEAAPLALMDHTIDGLERRLVYGAVLILSLAMVAIGVAVYLSLRPLDAVVATATAVAHGEREQRIPTDRGPREIRRLSAVLDEMLEAQRAALVRQEQSQTRLRQFVADASHELQTPITSVLGWTQLQRKADLQGPEREGALDRIESEAHRMSALVEELSLLARLDEGIPLQRTRLDLADVAREAVASAHAVDPGRPLTIHAPGPAWVDGDPLRLRQVLDNLVANARLHTPAGTPVHVTVRTEDRAVVLVVRDEGPGIDPTQLARVFDRFWRADASRTRATGGSGLGLSIVAAIVQAHHGTISAENAADGGAAFTARFPAAGPGGAWPPPGR